MFVTSLTNVLRARHSSLHIQQIINKNSFLKLVTALTNYSYTTVVLETDLKFFDFSDVVYRGLRCVTCGVPTSRTASQTRDREFIVTCPDVETSMPASSGMAGILFFIRHLTVAAGMQHLHNIIIPEIKK